MGMTRRDCFTALFALWVTIYAHAAPTTIKPTDRFGVFRGAAWKPEFITRFYHIDQDQPVKQTLGSVMARLFGGYPDIPILTKDDARTMAGLCNERYPVMQGRLDWNLWRRIGCAAKVSYLEVTRKISLTPPHSDDREAPCQRFERGFHSVMAYLDRPQGVRWDIGAVILQASESRTHKGFGHVLNRLTITVDEFYGLYHRGRVRLSYALDVGWEGWKTYIHLHPANKATVNFHEREVYDSEVDFPIPGTSAYSLRAYREQETRRVAGN
jgi:hypothetical protein